MGGPAFPDHSEVREVHIIGRRLAMPADTTAAIAKDLALAADALEALNAAEGLTDDEWRLQARLRHNADLLGQAAFALDLGVSPGWLPALEPEAA